MQNFQKKKRPGVELRPPEKNKTGFKDKLTAAVLFASLVATALTFIGYGVAAAANSAFNIPHEALFQSPFELIELSVWAIAQFISWAGSLTFNSLYIKLLYRALFIAFIFFVAWLFTYALIKLPSTRKKYSEKVIAWRKSLLTTPHENVPWKLVFLQAAAAAASFILATPLIAMFVLYVLIACGILMPAVSLVGMTSAEKHIQDYVVGPERCQPLMNRVYRLKHQGHDDDKVATCLVVILGKNEYRGREVLTTSSATLLFLPDSGKVVRIPLNRATVETVGAL